MEGGEGGALGRGFFLPEEQKMNLGRVTGCTCVCTHAECPRTAEIRKQFPRLCNCPSCVCALLGFPWRQYYDALSIDNLERRTAHIFPRWVARVTAGSHRHAQDQTAAGRLHEMAEAAVRHPNAAITGSVRFGGTEQLRLALLIAVTRASKKLKALARTTKVSSIFRVRKLKAILLFIRRPHFFL